MMSEWKRSEDWSMLETEHAHAAASVEASRSMDTGRWCATIRIWIRDEHTCDDSFLRSPAVFVTQSEAEEWCERAVTAVLPLMPATQREGAEVISGSACPQRRKRAEEQR